MEQNAKLTEMIAEQVNLSDQSKMMIIEAGGMRPIFESLLSTKSIRNATYYNYIRMTILQNISFGTNED